MSLAANSLASPSLVTSTVSRSSILPFLSSLCRLFCPETLRFGHSLSIPDQRM
jgi:hypothetical protein